MIKTFRFDTDRQEFSANTYVVGEKGGRCVVIDLGSTQDRVIEFIKENFTSCSGILLTHGHYDHIRGIRKFLNTFFCTVFVHQDDQELLEDPKLNLTHFQPEEDDISLNLSNICRIDFLIDKKAKKVYVNESNTIPGSLSFYLWEPIGVPYDKLLDRMITIAIKDFKRKQKKVSTFETNVLSNFGGAKGMKGLKGMKTKLK